MIDTSNLLEEIQLLKDSMIELHAEHQSELKAVVTSQKEIVYVMKQLSASDREQKMMLNLKRSVELDYDLHVKDNIKAWTAEYCKSCRSIRTIMSQYEGQNNPVLATETEEKRLLRHLNKITRRAERTAEEDEIIRRGYFKVLHRVLDSLSTMDHRDEMDRLQLKRTVQFISSRLVDFWNSSVPVIKSFYRDGEIRLISSQAVFQDIWTSIRSQRYLRESRERALLAGCSVVGRKTGSASSTSSNLKTIQALAKRTINNTVRRTQKRHSYSASSSPSASSQSSVHTSPSSSSSSRGHLSPAMDSIDSPYGETYAVSEGDSPVVGRSMPAARRYGIQTRSVTSTNSSPVSTHSNPSTSGSVLPRKSLYSDNDYASEQEDDGSDDSDDEMLFGDAESDAGKSSEDPESELETPHQVRWDWTAETGASVDSISDADAQSAEDKVNAIFKKHLGDKSKKFSRADLENCTTPASGRERMVLSGSSISCDWDGDEADLGVDSDAEHEEKNGEEDAEKVQESDNEEDAEIEETNQVEESDEQMEVEDTADSDASQESTPARKTHLRWAPLNEQSDEDSDEEPQPAAQRERSLSSLFQVTPHQFIVQSGAAAKVSASPIGRAHLGLELCSSAEQVASSTSPEDVAAHTLTPQKVYVGADIKSPESILSSESRKKHKSHKKKKAKLDCDAEMNSPIDASSPSAVSARKSPSTPASSVLALTTSFQSPAEGCGTADGQAASSSARSHLSASFQSPCADDASQVSSVCTHATTPSNGLVYLDLQRAKADNKLRKKERRERRRLKSKEEGSEDGSCEAHGKLKQERSDSMSVASMATERNSGSDLHEESPASEVHDRSALTAILGSLHTPSPVAQQ